MNTAPADERLIQLETTMWGRFGTNGLNSDVKRHGEQIGDLYGRDETLRQEVDARISGLGEKVNAKLDGLYKLIATLIVSILIGAGGIIATLVVTAK